MPTSLTSAQKREMKGRAQKMDPTLRIGRAGLSEGWLRSMEEELTQHQLVKIRFAELKEERKQLAPEIAARTGSELVTLVGNVAVFYRPKPAPTEPA